MNEEQIMLFDTVLALENIFQEILIKREDDEELVALVGSWLSGNAACMTMVAEFVFPAERIQLAIDMVTNYSSTDTEFNVQHAEMVKMKLANWLAFCKNNQEIDSKIAAHLDQHMNLTREELAQYAEDFLRYGRADS